MLAPLKAFWWSPRRDLRVLAHELRDHGRAWGRLLAGPGRAFTNYGDELSELVLREALGRRVAWAPLGREDVVAIGSAMGPYIARGGVGRIWGTGLHTPDVPAASAELIRHRVLAIRGPLARDAFGLHQDTPLGDPGLLVRALRPGRPAGRRRGTVLITHFTSHADRQQREAIAAIAACGVRVLPPTLSPAAMLDEIGAAEHVVSAGMHGIILAHALRTPATLVSLRPRTPSDVAFKYHDYHRSVGLDVHVTGWRSLVSSTGRSAARMQGERDLEVVDARIDDLVDGLLAAAAPLRSSS
ncbi:hypothetical protein FHW23_000037 [Curtobacterium pusillum]|uniref:Polysaccharide pyruvyl transferase domain-containing protein n=1 Tax=Curtobacterium pusillum TaxID=69373 RepID=A0AAW3T0U9_9MICO|nr:hypothetical protein [Curtobacterium pusillum]MBA8988805.1 hypothetical protein [Curtobacterium pusillum]